MARPSFAVLPLTRRLVSHAILLASPILASGLVGCASAPATPEEVDSQAQDSTSTHPEDLAPYAGSYAWREGSSGAFVDFTELTLETTGAFEAVADEDVTGKPIRCIKAPCASPVDGQWAVLRGKGETKLRFAVAGRPNRSYHVAVETDGLRLTRDSVTTKLFVVAKEASCHKTGCSGTVCSAEEIMTTCQFRPEYACYQSAICERRADGTCGFRATSELSSCLAEHASSAE